VVGDEASPRSERSIGKTLTSVVYLGLVALLPAAAIIDLINHRWYYLFVALVLSAVQLPVAVSLIKRPGPATKLIVPIVLVVLLAILMVGAALS
jgi:hypothetical protein